MSPGGSTKSYCCPIPIGSPTGLSRWTTVAAQPAGDINAAAAAKIAPKITLNLRIRPPDLGADFNRRRTPFRDPTTKGAARDPLRSGHQPRPRAELGAVGVGQLG